MAALNFFDTFMADSMNQVHDLSSDDLKIVLTDVAPVATDSVLTDIMQITAANGYPADGQSLDNITSTQTSGVYSLTADDETFTAAGGSMAQFRYGVLYNPDSTGDRLIGWWDKTTEVNLSTGQTFDFNFVSGDVFTLRD